ncbi:MAG: tRNA (adenosine(37)-N6)-dimethylallyltransferase MiaA [Opitutaceae bacterium]
MKPAAPSVHVLTGATAVGKTEAALRWARAAGAEILSCDSLLFYRGMDVGTAKPAAEERSRVPHHLIDILPVAEPMDVSRYARLAREAADEIAARGRQILVVGGSGFYLKCFFGPVADGIEVPPRIRAEVELRLREAGLPAAVEDLRRLNPDGLGEVDPSNPRRVARALERCLASGRGLAALAADFARQPAPFAGWNVKLVELGRPPEEVERRIAARTRAMLAAGLVDEVKRLLGQGLRGNPSAARAIGYREVLAHLDGRLSAADLERTIVQSTRALVKKQRTWFRTQLQPHASIPADSEPPSGWFG